MKPLKQLIIGTVLGAVVILGVAATTPNEPQKWEYIQVTVMALTDWQVFSAKPSGTPKAPNSESLASILNFYGSKGWEYVEERQGRSSSDLFFKKAK